MTAASIVVPTGRLDLSGLGNVPAAYRHEWRVSTPREPLVLPGGVFKWYHVHREGAVVPDDLDATARAVVAEAAAGPWDLSYGLNIAQVHLSTTTAYLIPGIWRGHQELWQRPYFYDVATGGPFTRIDT
ncbi:MAG: hypothetical protein H0U29_10165, partial [Acidimicrobiia bacterium]|nr:hypothetical protein [Acidimicrobiia bacterium]